MSHHLLWIGVGSIAFCVGCSSAGEEGSVDDVGATEQSIWSGTPVPPGVRQDVVWVRRETACTPSCVNPTPTPPCYVNCTGTLLRNNVVLTARHCVTTNGNTDGPLAAASSLQVFASESAFEFVTGAQVQTRPLNEDVAMIFLNAPLPVAGTTWGHQTPIYPYRADEHVSQTLPVYGYGWHADIGGCKTLSAPNMLSGQVRVMNAHQPPQEISGFLTKVPIDAWATSLTTGVGSPWRGDSGSAMFSPLSYPESAYGVLSGVAAGFVGFVPNFSDYGSPEDYRNGVLDAVVGQTPNLFDNFTVATSIDAYDRIGHGGALENWTWTPTGIQESTPSESKFLINRAQIMEDAIVAADVLSGGDAGVIVRWVDEEHFYLAWWRDSDNTAIIFKRRAGAWIQLATTIGACDFTWSNNPRLLFTASGANLQAGMIGGAGCNSIVQDTEFPTGRIGVFKNGGTFKMNRFSITHLGGSEAGWNKP